MDRLADKILLLLYGLAGVALVGPDSACVAGFYLALALAACGFFLSGRLAVGILSSCFCLGAILQPEFRVFLPLLSYDMIGGRQWIPLALALGASLRVSSAATGIYLALGYAFSLLLEGKSRELEKRGDRLRRIRDDGVEKTLLLKAKNKELQEKQDYEIYAATLQERNRIARDIHDNVGHVLSRTILMTGALKTMNQDPNLKEPLAQLEESLQQAMDSIRASVHDIHDDSIDLKKSTEALLADFHFCPVELDYDMGRAIPRKVKYCFLTVLKEALVNVTKHSRATRVQVVVREHPALYQLRIQDNGKKDAGPSARFPESDSKDARCVGDFPERMEGSGIGLQNMRDRVEALQGHIQISRDKGFGIFITIPKEVR